MADLDLTAGILNITMEQGARLYLSLKYRDDNQDIVPLSTYTARMQLRSQAGADDLALELTTENDRIILSDEAPNIILDVSSEDTAAITAATYKYDLELVAADGEVEKPFKGKFKLKAEVTV